MSKCILHITSTLDRADDAGQLCLLAAGLPRDEFDVHVCALARGGPLAADLQRAGVPCSVIGKRWTVDPWAILRLKEHIARLRPDVIHAWTSAAGVYAQAVGRVCGAPRLVVTQRPISSWTTRIERAVDRALVGRAYCAVVNGESVRDDCVRYGFPGERIRVIPYGVAPAERPASTRRQALESLGLPEGARLIAWIGRLSLQNRVKDAIWSTDLLKVIRDDAHLLLIGGGPRRDVLRTFRDQVRIRDKVHFLGERGDVPQLLPHCDLLWSTSECGGEPGAILEAMAAGLPVVATDIPAARECVVANATGYLVPVGDRAEFAKYTERLLNDATLAGQMGAAGRDRAAAEFSVQKMVDRHADLYRRVLLML